MRFPDFDPGEDECWRIVPDYEVYAVSTYGRVAHTRYERVLKDIRGVDGRRWVALYLDGVRKNKYVHQLMGAAFIIGFEWGDPIGHLNGIYWDNRLDNLDPQFYHMGYNTFPEWAIEEREHGWSN